MKIFVRVFIAVAVLCLSHSVEAEKLPWWKVARNKITVTVAPNVKEKIRNSTGEERKQMEDAIRVGNQFIPLHFSGDAYDTEPDNTDWNEETKPLIALKRDAWKEQLDGINPKKVNYKNGVGYTYREVCPQILLSSVEQDDEKTTLLYKTRSIGTSINYQGDLYDFNIEGAGASYELRIELNTSNLVDHVIFPDTWLSWSYIGSVASMKEFLADHSRAGYATKEHLDEMIRSYPIVIKKMEEQAAKICK